MSELPKNWTDGTTVEDVAEIRSGNGFPKKYQGRTEGELPFFKVGDISRNWQKGQITLTKADHYLTREESKEIRAKTLPEGSVVFAKIGAAVALNRRAILGTEALVDNNVMGLVPSEATTSRFLFYYMCQVDLGAATRGGAVPSLRKGDLGTLNLPLPPLSEQRRIVARIEKLFSRLDAGVAALRHAKAQLQRYRQSVLAAAVTGQLSQAWREQHPDTEPADEMLERALSDARDSWDGKRKFVEPAILEPKGLSKLPSRWVWAGVEQTGEVKLGRQRSPKHMTGDHIRPYLRVANVYEDRIKTSNVNEMNFTPEEFKIYELKFGDILLNEGQSLEWVGRPAMYRDEIEGCCFQNTLVRYRAHDSVLPAYALTVFRSYLHRGRFQKIAKWTNNIAHLGAGRFKEVEFPLPPLAEQHQIVAEVESRTTAIDHLEAELERQSTRSNRLRQSILSSAFSGRI